MKEERREEDVQSSKGLIKAGEDYLTFEQRRRRRETGEEAEGETGVNK
jgi:hypothetical protein